MFEKQRFFFTYYSYKSVKRLRFTMIDRLIYLDRLDVKLGPPISRFKSRQERLEFASFFFHLDSSLLRIKTSGRFMDIHCRQCPVDIL